MSTPTLTLDQLGWSITSDVLPPGVLGGACWVTRTVVLDRRLTAAERRCTLAHELEHVLRGSPPEDPVLAAREELWVEQAAARRLISLDSLATVLVWTQDWNEAAEELGVDVPGDTSAARGNSPSRSHAASPRRPQSVS